VGRLVDVGNQNLEGFQNYLSSLAGVKLNEISFSKDRITNVNKMEDKKAYFFWEDHPLVVFGDYERYIAKLVLNFGTDNAESYEVATKVHRYGIGILCTWHLLKNAKSIAAYVGEYDSDGYMARNLDLIKNHIVKRVVLIPEKLNLFIEFDNRIWLGIFPHFVGYSFSSSRGSGRAWSSAKWTVFNQEIYDTFLMS
jgi:hypothetical protein